MKNLKFILYFCTVLFFTSALKLHAQIVYPPLDSLTERDRAIWAIYDSAHVNTPSAHAYVQGKFLEYRINIGDTAVAGFPPAEYTGPSLTLNINGHLYQAEDYIIKYIDKLYQDSRTGIENAARSVFGQGTLVGTPQNTYVGFFPTNVQNTTGYMVAWAPGAKIVLMLPSCQLAIYADLLITSDWIIVRDSLEAKIRFSNPRLSIPWFWALDVPFHFGWDDYGLDFWDYACQEAANAINTIGLDYLAAQMLLGADPIRVGLDSYEMPLFKYADLKIGGCQVTQQVVTEAMNALPISIGLEASGSPALKLNIKLASGTPENPSAFENVFVPSPANSTLDYLGFAMPYNVVDASYWVGRPQANYEERQTYLLDQMQSLSTQSVRVEVPWKDIVGDLPSTTVPDVDQLEGTSLDAVVNELLARSTWAQFDSVVARALRKGMDVIPMIAQGHTTPSGNPIPTMNGHTIAPDTQPGLRDNMTYVDANTYLYYLKVFSHAVVRRYRNNISLWMIEGELNAARLNHLFCWWRKGNLWADESSNGFQDRVWHILVNAVRQEDPYPNGKITSMLHILNLVKGLQRFGADMDVVGVNIYPNLQLAAPVMGYMAGETVWATRRALIGLNMGDKPVIVTETNYPALSTDLSEQTAPDAPPDSTFNFFSYGRQMKYMQDAITSSVQRGAKGFFWFSFLTTETPAPEEPFTNFGGLLRRDTWTFKNAASTFLSKVPTSHPGKAQVTLANKSIGSEDDLGGMVALFAERDSLISGSTVPTIKDRDHTSRTYQQYLQGIKHQSWNNTSPEFRLKEIFHPSLSQDTVKRIARFSAPSQITITSNVPDIVSGQQQFRDPWYVEPTGAQAGEQINQFRSISRGNYEVFLEQNPDPGNPNKPYYSVSAQLTVVDSLSRRWKFAYWEPTNAGVDVIPVTSRPYEAAVIFHAANASVRAYYNPVFSLMLDATTGGTTAINPNKSEYDNGETVQLTATPTGNYFFIGWTGDTVTTANPLNIVMNRSFTIRANFSDQPPAAPTPASPANGATNIVTNPTLSWNATTGATSYRLQIATDSLFSTPVFNDSTITGTSRQLDTLTFNALHYWRVQAKYGTITSNWSTVWNFRTMTLPAPSKPVLVSPTNGASGVVLSPTFKWKKSNYATTYTLQLAFYADFINNLQATANTSDTSYTLNGLNGYTTYYWRVTAHNASGDSISSIFNFYTAIPVPPQPTLTAPEWGLTVSTQPSLSWGYTSYASSYKVQWARTSNFSNADSIVVPAPNTYCSLTGLLPYTSYFWRVQAINVSGQSNWSDLMMFNTGDPPPAPPTLQAPANGGINMWIPVTFNWYQVCQECDNYLQAATDSTFATGIAYNASVGSSGSWTGASIYFQPRTKYYWRMRASSSINGVSVWSTTRSFTTVPLVTLVSPPNGTTGVPTSVPYAVPVYPVLLKWNYLPGAGSYNVQGSTDSSFSTVEWSQMHYQPTDTSENHYYLPYGTKYYWRVCGIGSQGWGPYSARWSFTTAALPAVPTLASPTNNATNIETSPTLKWRLVSEATSYRLQVSTNSSFSSFVLNDSTITDTLKQVNSLSNNTIYYWRVNAKNTVGTSGWSSAWSFTTVGPPPSAPTATAATNVSNIGFTANWSAAGGATAYLLDVSTLSDFSSYVGSYNSVNVGNVTAMYVSGLSPSTTYYYRIRATNAGGISLFSNAVSITTLAALLPPDTPALYAPSNGATNAPLSQSISWYSSSRATFYVVYWSGGGNSGSTTVTSTSYTIPGLTYATTYYWYVVAGNDAGLSSPSDQWGFTTLTLTHYISASLNGNGTISPYGATVQHGYDQTFNITPFQGNDISDVVINGSTHLGANVWQYTFYNVTADGLSIAAYFTPKVCTQAGPPSYVSASWGLNPKIEISWDFLSGSCNALYFNIYRSPSTTNWEFIGSVSSSGLWFFEDYPPPDYRYYNYYITTVDEFSRESAPSPIATGSVESY